MFANQRGPIIAAAILSAVIAKPAVAGGFDDIFTVHHQAEVGGFLGVFIPSDKHEFYDPGKSEWGDLRAIALDLGVRLAYSPIPLLALELEGNIIPTSNKRNEDRATLLGLRPQLLVQHHVGAGITPFIAGGMGVLGVVSKDASLGSDADFTWHGGLGAKYAISPDLNARIDLRLLGAPRVNSEKGTTAHGEILLGVAYRFWGGEAAPEQPKVVDTDKDGIADAEDKCPNKAGPAPTGCPDTDGDGLDDSADSCPEKPETANGFEDEDGCPDEIPDTDGDGIDDQKDKCPSEPEDIDQFEDENGCPDTDNDTDGVLDTADGCPLKAGPVENRGCPDTDRDGDSIVDRLDNCPDEPGTAANQGCKKKQMVVITGTNLKILDKVYFSSGRAKIRRRSFRLLDQVAKVISAHPEIPKVLVEGHTDDRGKDEFNMDLSQKRAEAVAAYLIGKGVSANRLEAKGFGETKPLGPNDSRANRAANRRVEFRIVQPEPTVAPAPEAPAPTAPPAPEANPTP